MITQANRKWWALAGSSLGLFLLMLDSTIVTLALPTIQKELDASDQQLQWVLNGYLLALSVLVVTAGRLGDMFGRRTVFIIGMFVFGIGSIVAATAPSADVLIVGRIIQGFGGASILVLSVAITSNAFPASERAKALGIWAGVSAIALALGPLVGGTLIETIGWRAIFWINMLPLAAGITITLAAASDTRDPGAGDRIDWPGLALFSVGLTALILPLVQSSIWGWTSAVTIGLLCLAVASLIAFWFVEHRVDNPIVDFTLFRSRPYLGAAAAAFGMLACYWTTMFFQPQYLQNVLDYSPVEAGLLILPLTAPMVVISPIAGRLIAFVGGRVLMTTGMALVLVSMLLFTQIDSGTGYSDLLWPYLIFGVALGLVYAPMQTAAMTALPQAKAGIAAGVLAMDRMCAGALGLAGFGALFKQVEQKELTSRVSEQAPTLNSEGGELDGLLAGSAQAKAQLSSLPADLAMQIEQTVEDVYSYALARASWILVGFAATGLVATWAFTRSSEQPDAKPEQLDPDPAGAGVPHHHWHRLRFHL